jgi:hypothetical protein
MWFKIVFQIWMVLEKNKIHQTQAKKNRQRMKANAEVATVLGSIPSSSDTVESEGRQMKQC